VNYKITQNNKIKEIKINFYKDLDKTHIKVTNFMGFVFLNENVTTTEVVLNLSNKDNAVYFVQITINNNTTIEKVIF
jgi:hypothetical protein